jgi:hypothetical protein
LSPRSTGNFVFQFDLWNFGNYKTTPGSPSTYVHWKTGAPPPVVSFALPPVFAARQLSNHCIAASTRREPLPAANQTVSAGLQARAKAFATCIY